MEDDAERPLSQSCFDKYNMYKCSHCSKICGNSGSLSVHTSYCKLNPTRLVSNSLKGRKLLRPIWNKGLSSETDPRLIKMVKKMKGKKFGGCLNHTKETKDRLSVIATNRGIGGYQQGSGRGKKGWYKDFFCDSSWELAYVIYSLDNAIDIKRNTEKRKYFWDGKEKNYIPDFIVEGTITEIKGYKTEQWLAKLEANPDVKVLYKTELQPILDYVIMKYGKDFIRLYGR